MALIPYGLFIVALCLLLAANQDFQPVRSFSQGITLWGYLAANDPHKCYATSFEPHKAHTSTNPRYPSHCTSFWKLYLDVNLR